MTSISPGPWRLGIGLVYIIYYFSHLSSRSAHELHPKDILSLVVLAGTLFPQTETLEDLFSRQWGVGEVRSRPSSQVKMTSSFADNSDAGDDEVHLVAFLN